MQIFPPFILLCLFANDDDDDDDDMVMGNMLYLDKWICKTHVCAYKCEKGGLIFKIVGIAYCKI